MFEETLDVLIVGAGISGISAACHMQKKCPNKSFAMVEARQEIGGTWDLFKYPGIRSDTDMYSFGFSFKPWKNKEAFGEAANIKAYLKETLEEHQLYDKIQFGFKVLNASWSTQDALWTVEIEESKTQTKRLVTCRFLFMCGGYYTYDKGFMPDYPNVESFEGKLIHPQFWEEGLNYDDKKIVIIGSGATAATIMPAMAEKAKHVTLLQRSPSYVLTRPSHDKNAYNLQQKLPLSIATPLIRARNIFLNLMMHYMCRTNPEKAKAMFIGGVRKALGDDYDIEKHFTPSYNPWQQRACFVPDGDMFKAIKSGKASMVTDHIESFTPKGIKLKSGETLEADIIISATGLNMKMFNGVQFTIDGKLFNLAESVNFKGVSFSGLPNFASTFGYTKASWTLKADLTSQYVCRLLNYMDKNNYKIAMPKAIDPQEPLDPWSDFTSSYFQRAMPYLPKQGRKKPWSLNQSYLPDMIDLRLKPLGNGDLVFKS